MIEIVIAQECRAPVWWTLAELRADRPACFIELMLTQCIHITEAEADAFYRWAATVPGWRPHGASAWNPEPVKYKDLERQDDDPNYWRPSCSQP